MRTHTHPPLGVQKCHRSHIHWERLPAGHHLPSWKCPSVGHVLERGREEKEWLKEREVREGRALRSAVRAAEGTNWGVEERGPQLHHEPAGGPWTSCFPDLGLDSLILNMGRLD